MRILFKGHHQEGRKRPVIPDLNPLREVLSKGGTSLTVRGEGKLGSAIAGNRTAGEPVGHGVDLADHGMPVSMAGLQGIIPVTGSGSSFFLTEFCKTTFVQGWGFVAAHNGQRFEQ